MMDKNSKIYVAGHRGLVGSAIVRELTAQGYGNLILRTREELDLLDQRAVADFFNLEKPDYVFLAAAKVGGIMANKEHKAEFIYENLQIELNIVHNAWRSGVKKLLFLGSSCIYPKQAQQPIKEEYLLTGPLEETNDAYAMAKIAGIKMCQSYREQYKSDFIAVMPTNLYGPGDNFNLTSSHVLPAMIRKFHEAKITHQTSVTLWGDGTPYREFLYVDDLANACVYLMNNYSESEIVNIGTGQDLTIKDLADKIKNIVGFSGEIVWDSSKPNGTPKKLLDVSRLSNLGWLAKTDLNQGVSLAYDWYLNNAV
ncbi:MAG: GDP-L-fucose synthase [Candidatus Falkowbacteria bacterium]